jgi:hypothetical protein
MLVRHFSESHPNFVQLMTSDKAIIMPGVLARFVAVYQPLKRTVA